MFSRAITVFALSVGILSAAASATAQTVMVGGAPMYPSKNIVDNAMNSKDHTTLVAAVKAAGLVETLQSKGPFTVFAPVNAAFDKLPAGTVDMLLKPEHKTALRDILTYHVVPGKIQPTELEGTTQTTVQGADLEVTGSGQELKVNDANVICGGVQTANATVYLIDEVLMPTM